MCDCALSCAFLHVFGVAFKFPIPGLVCATLLIQGPMVSADSPRTTKLLLLHFLNFSHFLSLNIFTHQGATPLATKLTTLLLRRHQPPDVQLDGTHRTNQMRKAGLSPDNILWHTLSCNHLEGKVLLSGHHPSQASVCQDVWSRTAECG